MYLCCFRLLANRPHRIVSRSKFRKCKSVAGLDAGIRLWLILDEYNQDVVGQSFYLEPEPPLGRFSKAFFLPLMKNFIARRADVRGVNRRR